MDDEEVLNPYGTPLEPLEKDEVPAKKPIAVEDQIVKDENGKRRFHGAFTGGFSAGFWNTVGSQEGWTPQSFKSSRKDKAGQRPEQRPEDFMDQEDLGEFGIAPQGIRTRDEFAKGDDTGGGLSRKRKFMQPNAGAIPGVPVLEQLLKPVRDKVAVRILKSMGWKPGQGVGPRQTRKEKRQAKARNNREQYLQERYGCGEEDGLRAKATAGSDGESNGSDDDDDEDDEEITFAPDDYEPLFYAAKDNRFGMSYSGLSRAPVLSKTQNSGENVTATPAKHINLFAPLEVMDKHKKLSIRGQAFGVGALEEEDEDIYARDDMTRYDFTLGGDGKPKQKKKQHVQALGVIAGFVEDKSDVTYNQPYTIELPRDFVPRNWAERRSRFEPLEPERARKLEHENQHKKAGLGRHDLDAEQRAKMLGEKLPERKQEQKVSKNPFKSNVDKTKDLLARINATSSNFTRGGIINSKGEEQSKQSESLEVSTQVQETHTKLLEKAAAKTKHLDTTSGNFKPFLGDDLKQERYEKFLASNLKDEMEITNFLNEIQPVTLSAWDREMEKKEFMQARKIYKPLGGIMSDRFVSEAVVVAEQVKQEVAVDSNEQKVIMERTKCMWKPSALLCKRYNIAEPFGGALPEDEKPQIKKPRMSVFDYLETSINTKSNFQTPVIIPKHKVTEKPAVAAPSLPVSVPANAAEKQKPTKAGNSTEPAAAAASANETTAAANGSKPAAKPHKIYTPKTELEQRVEASKDKPIEEKTELFKSIFDDSDEETEISTEVASTSALSAEEAEAARIANLKAQLGLPTTTTNAAAANVLRNNSPPRGIFATLFSVPEQPKIAAPTVEKVKEEKLVESPKKITFKPRNERMKNSTDETPADVYGPQIPKDISQRTITTQDVADAELDGKLMSLWQQQKLKAKKSDKSSSKSKNLEIEEKWIEKCLNKDGPVDVSSEDSSMDSSSSSSSESDDEDSKSYKRKMKKMKKQFIKKSKISIKKKVKKKSKKKSKKSGRTHKTKKNKH